ncbi:hypothetical protein [Hyphomonas sp.]|uniref:hypothetical protein n=1 Tax=Hyphomonas sp. TaxID=87 RepID=UPI003D2E2405
MLSPAEGYNITDGNDRARLVRSAGLASAGEPDTPALYMIGGDAARTEKSRAPEPDIQSDRLGLVHWKGV